MCCRYYFADNLINELEEEDVFQTSSPAVHALSQGREIRPTDYAPVLSLSEKGILLSLKRWGFSSSWQKSVLINARSETVLEKKTFQSGIRHHRAVIPASCFYEWDRKKVRHTFSLKGSPLYLAGFFDLFAPRTEGEKMKKASDPDGLLPTEKSSRFVILTAPANASMIEVHDRMPLLLDRADLPGWFSGADVRRILDSGVSQLLDRDLVKIP